jgi:hypothetical protein
VPEPKFTLKIDLKILPRIAKYYKFATYKNPTLFFYYHNDNKFT